MHAETLYDDGERRWLFFGRDPGRSQNVIDTNQYLILHEGAGLLLDPGGIEIFPSFVAALSAEVDLDRLEGLFSSHQDPDIISSLSLWLGLNADLRCYASWTWAGFIPHFGGGRPVDALPDEGTTIPLGDSSDLRAVPAHYCHSSGNFTLYDPRARILFSGDLGASLLPADRQGLWVTDFDSHVAYMEGFHRRWMPSNRAKNDWIRRVRALDIDLLCPQHGAMFRGDDVQRFLDWLEALEVGSAIP